MKIENNAIDIGEKFHTPCKSNFEIFHIVFHVTFAIKTLRMDFPSQFSQNDVFEALPTGQVFFHLSGGT